MPRLSSALPSGLRDCHIVFGPDGQGKPWPKTKGPPPDDAIWVQYDPNHLTQEAVDEKAQLAKAGDQFLASYDLVKLIHAWDLQDDDGQDIPVTREGVRHAKLSAYQIGQLYSAIIADLYPSPEALRA